MEEQAPLDPANVATSTSAFAPLFSPTFRRLWIVWLIANTCMWMNDVAAAWLMTSLTNSPMMVALVQTAGTLPVFLLGMPSGALADIVDRRRYFMVTQFWVALTGTLLCVALLSGAMNPTLLLLLTFANGIGLAMRWPVYSAIIPELVTRAQLPASMALNGVAMNASRIIGPIVAGALIASAGTAVVFVLNAVLSVLAGLVILTWKREVESTSALPGERFLGAMRVGFQYVRQSRRMRTVLLRVFIFFVQSAAVLALLPLLARQMPNGSASTFTVLLASMGTGAILSAGFLPRLRRLAPHDRLVHVGSLLQAAMMVVIAYAPNLWVAIPAMLVTGATWLTVANTLAVAAQLSLPNWVRARAMSSYQVALMGGSAVGAALWGKLADWTDLGTSITIAAVLGSIALWFTRGQRLGDTVEEDLTPSRSFKAPAAAWPFDAHDGPVLTTVEYRIDPARADEFLPILKETGRRRLARGALSCEAFRDTADPGRFFEYIVDQSWLEHLRHFDRLTAADEILRNQRHAFLLDGQPPVVSRSIAARYSRRRAQ